MIEECAQQAAQYMGLWDGCLPVAGGAQNWPFPERPKPPCSMYNLVMLALHELPGKKAGAPAVINYIGQKFPYYRQSSTWHNTVGKNLSSHPCFLKLPKQGDLSYHEYRLDTETEKAFNFEALKEKLKNHMDT